MYTTYNRVIESLEEKASRTLNVIEKRKAKVESLTSMIKTYTLALDEHKDFVDNREKKIEAGRVVLEELEELVVRMNDELAKEADSYFEGPDGRGFAYLRDETLVEEWEGLVKKFNRIHQGHGSK